MKALLLVLGLALSPLLMAADTVTPAELNSLIQAGKAPVIVDVRSRAEYDAGHVPGAIHVPFWSAYWRADQVPASGHDPVVVYCASGPRAGLAGWQLGLAGIPNIVTLEGHMTAWQQQRLPVVRPGQADTSPAN